MAQQTKQKKKKAQPDQHGRTCLPYKAQDACT